MKPLALVLSVLTGCLVATSSCSSAQKADEKAIATCTANDAAKIIAIFDDSSTNGATKLLELSALSPDVTTCVLKATAPPAVGSGSSS